MNSVVTFAGAVIALLALSYFALVGLGALVQHIARRLPDPGLQKIGHKFNEGCEFDREKYLACRLRLAQRQLDDARRRHSELFAAAHPEFRTPVFPRAAQSSSKHVFTFSDRFYRGQVRAALRRAQ